LRTELDFAAVSIAEKIADGFKNRRKADKLRYFNIAQGSIEESRDYLILAEDLPYGDVDEWRRLLEEVSKLPAAYSRAILNSGS
jgi:four helix bundle protein